MASSAGPGEIKIRSWLGPAGQEKKNQVMAPEPGRQLPAQARLSISTRFVLMRALQRGAKNPACEKSSHGCQPGSRNKNQVMARPSWPCEKKSGHGSGWLAELTNCHDLIFLSAKNPAAGNFAMGRMPWHTPSPSPLLNIPNV